MTRTLQQADVQAARETLLAEMSKGRQGGGLEEGTQALSGVLELLLAKALIPIFVSLTSALLKDVIKDKVLSAMKRRDAEQTLEELLKRKLDPKPELPDDCLEEAKRLLGPTGMQEADIRRLYAAVKQRVSHGVDRT